MKRSESIFFGVLIASMFILAACQVGPGQAVSKKTAAVQPAATTSGSGGAMPTCQGTGANGCGPAADDLQCCSGNTCVSGICIAQNTTCTTTCTPGTFCSGNTKINVSSNCQSTSINCPNGCSNGNCLPPPQQNCTPSVSCHYNITGSMMSANLSANCVNITTPCPKGCNQSNGRCNNAPSCTPSTTCVYGYLNYSTFGWYSQNITANCVNISALCQYGCNAANGNCYSTNQTQTNQSCTAGWSCILPWGGNASTYLNSGCINATYFCADRCNATTGQCTNTNNIYYGCGDSDGGIVLGTAGYISINGWAGGGTYDDCLGNNMIVEYYCTSSSSSSTFNGGAYTQRACSSGTTCQRISMNIPGVGTTLVGQCQ